jgi:hypothetical protein
MNHAAENADALHIERAPLYLFSRHGVNVELDGPALKIRLKEERLDRYLPLRRLSRIVADQKTQFATEALLACAQRGVTILFVQRDQAVSARLIGQAGERQEMRQRMLDLMQQPNWKDHYQQWRYAMERNTRRQIQQKLRAPAQHVFSAELKAWLDKRAGELSDPLTAKHSRLWLQQLAEAWMLNHLNQLGLGADSELLLDGWPDLVGDLTHILCWRLEPIRFGWLRRRYLWKVRHQRAPGSLSRRDMVNLYEKNASVISRHGRDISNQLHYWLVEGA